MHMIQLQYADEGGNNCGALYLNVNAIAAVRFEKSGPGSGSWCKILMVDGTEYRIVEMMSTVLDKIALSSDQGGER